MLLNPEFKKIDFGDFEPDLPPLNLNFSIKDFPGKIILLSDVCEYGMRVVQIWH